MTIPGSVTALEELTGRALFHLRVNATRTSLMLSHKFMLRFGCPFAVIRTKKIIGYKNRKNGFKVSLVIDRNILEGNVHAMDSF